MVIRNFNAPLYDYLGSEAAHGLLAELAALRQELDQTMITWAQGPYSQLAPGAFLDHTEKLYLLSGKLWSEATGKDLSSLVNFLLAHLKTIADDYRTQGPAWAMFDAALDSEAVGQ